MSSELRPLPSLAPAGTRELEIPEGCQDEEVLSKRAGRGEAVFAASVPRGRGREPEDC